MASQEDAANAGAKRRSGIPTMRKGPSAPTSPGAAPRRPIVPVEPPAPPPPETDKDSGLSSECTTPTNGSPPPRHQQQQQQRLQGGMIPRPRTKMVDIINASKARLQESEKSRLSNNRTARLLSSSRSSTDSPRSLDGTRKPQVFSPLRPPRNVQSPSLDSGDEGSVRIERGTYGYMFQDIVSIKTMLLKLKRVLQESGENGLTRDSLSPFDNSLKNGLFYNLNDSNPTTDLPDGKDNVVEELADLRRQVALLQSQLDDKDRTIVTLQGQLFKYKHNGGIEMANATTQTEKLRPASAGPSVLQGHVQDNSTGYTGWKVETDSWSTHHHHHHQHHHHQPQHGAKSDQLSSSCSSGVSTSSRPASSSRRSSSSSISDHRPSTPLHRPSSLRGLRLPNGSVTPPGSTSIPTPNTTTRISRLSASPTMIPRAARAVSASGRARDS